MQQSVDMPSENFKKKKMYPEREGMDGQSGMREEVFNASKQQKTN